MNSNRFSMAVHVLALLARHGGTMTSEEVARSVNTNPVVIRRILGRLRRAGLVSGVSGPNGGSELSESPEKITLFDIYQAVEERELICVHDAPSQRCPVGRGIQMVFESITGGVKRAVTKELKATKLSAIVRSFGG